MELSNDTPFPARLFHGHVTDEDKAAWVVARITLRRTPEGVLEPVEDDVWPVFSEALDTAVGRFPSDNVFLREGCDLVVAGTARPGREVTRHTVRARVDRWSTELHVSGDRVWEKTLRGDLAPSAPLPFTEMPLTWQRAFGGTTAWQGQPAPHPLNPEGRGFYWSAEDAREKPLANLEDPRHLVTRWDERPLPAAWGPVTNTPLWHATQWFADRARAGDTALDAEAVSRASIMFFEGSAPPARILPSLAPGAVLELTGLGPTPWRAVVPDVPLRLEARVGSLHVVRDLHYAGLWALVDHDLVVLTARCNFRYPLVARERRAAALGLAGPVRARP